MQSSFVFSEWTCSLNYTDSPKYTPFCLYKGNCNICSVELLMCLAMEVAFINIFSVKILNNK